MEYIYEVEPQLISADLMFHVSEWLLGHVPLSYFRDWQVDMYVNHSSCISAPDLAFLRRFEGIYAEFSDWPDIENREYLRNEHLKRETHKAICGWQSPSLNTSTRSTQIVSDGL